jgi:hypothetical protein
MAGQLTVDTLRASTGVLATQNGMTGIAKAWCNFTGSSATINGSFNVSSVTRNSTGNYTVNFTTAMSNANYAWAISYVLQGSNTNASSAINSSPTTSAINVLMQRQAASGGTYYDTDYQCAVTIFGA